jgi:hypothetical protein
MKQLPSCQVPIEPPPWSQVFADNYLDGGGFAACLSVAACLPLWRAHRASRPTHARRQQAGADPACLLPPGYHVPHAHKGLAGGLDLGSYSSQVFEMLSVQVGCVLVAAPLLGVRP